MCFLIYCSNVHILIQMFLNKHLLSTYCMSGTVLDAWDTVVSMTDKIPALTTTLGGRYNCRHHFIDEKTESWYGYMICHSL